MTLTITSAAGARAISRDLGLERRLAGAVTGDVRFDAFTRGRYATDASIYQIMPAGVVVPLQHATRHPRGALVFSYQATEARFAREFCPDKRTHCVRRGEGGERGTRGGPQESRFLRSAPIRP